MTATTGWVILTVVAFLAGFVTGAVAMALKLRDMRDKGEV